MTLTALLWFLDEILTLKDSHKYGIISERNPIMKHFLRKGKKQLVLFKILSFSIFAFLQNIVFSLHPVFFYLISVIIILTYIFVDVNNYMLLYKEL